MDATEIAALKWLGIFMSLCIGIAVICHRKTKTKPRPMATPFNDSRSSLLMHRKIVSRQ